VTPSPPCSRGREGTASRKGTSRGGGGPPSSTRRCRVRGSGKRGTPGPAPAGRGRRRSRGARRPRTSRAGRGCSPASAGAPPPATPPPAVTRRPRGAPASLRRREDPDLVARDTDPHPARGHLHLAVPGHRRRGHVRLLRQRHDEHLPAGKERLPGPEGADRLISVRTAGPLPPRAPSPSTRGSPRRPSAPCRSSGPSASPP